MGLMYVLFEHASGYGLFKVKEFEEVGMLLPQVEQSVTDLSRFNSIIKLIGFYPFKTAVVALENVNSISEGTLPSELQLFLETNLPISKGSKVVLGVVDPKLGSAISETLGITCNHVGAIPEIVRGIRFHFHKLVKGFTKKSANTAELGLGHSYSRGKVKFDINRSDNMIIQSIALLDQLDKDINTFSMRIREWYSYHFPELVKIVPDNYMYARVSQFIKNRKEFDENSLEGLEELVQDSGIAQAILEASRQSMGMDISPIDLVNIEMFAGKVVRLTKYRQDLAGYLRSKMSGVAPNLATLIGEQVGARLISHAGSLTNLAKYPASTVQILGAEKALFRALKNRGNTPKYGLLFHSSFIGRAETRNKGRISRYLANKCSIASRIDCFTEYPTNIYGEKLREQVEERLKFFECGTMPRKNIEVMKLAMEEALAHEEAAKSKQKKKKKKKQQKLEEEEADMDATANGTLDETISSENLQTPKKKKKSKKRKVEEEEADMDTTANGTLDDSIPNESLEIPKKKKKKKKQSLIHNDE